MTMPTCRRIQHRAVTMCRGFVIAAAVGLLLVASVGRTSAFECGQPYSACGLDIPKNVTCEKGAGWCQPGYYCGAGEGGKSQCLPVPKDCGKAGNPCCPSNADVPHNDASDKAQASREPFCRDGSTCWWDYLELRLPPYMGITAPAKGTTFGGCIAIPKDCGTGEGSPCCPTIYKSSFNPPVRVSLCPEGMFCNFHDPRAKAFPGSNPRVHPPGICYKQKPDCGTFGKTCCIRQGWATSRTDCGPPKGSTAGPQRGYCELAPADSVDAGYELCKPCPAVLPEGLDSNKTENIKLECNLGG